MINLYTHPKKISAKITWKEAEKYLFTRKKNGRRQYRLLFSGKIRGKEGEILGVR